MPLRRRLPLCDESGPAMVMGSLSFAAATGTPPAITSKKADTEDECSGRCFYMRPQCHDHLHPARARPLSANAVG